MNSKNATQAKPAERMWWWHPHFADVAGQAVAEDAAGTWWWHPHLDVEPSTDF